MNNTKIFLDSVLNRNHPLESKVGPLVQPDHSGDKKVCLEFNTSSGRSFFVEASKVFDHSPVLEDRDADYVWRNGVPSSELEDDEDWETVSWALLPQGGK